MVPKDILADKVFVTAGDGAAFVGTDRACARRPRDIIRRKRCLYAVERTTTLSEELLDSGNVARSTCTVEMSKVDFRRHGRIGRAQLEVASRAIAVNMDAVHAPGRWGVVPLLSRVAGPEASKSKGTGEDGNVALVVCGVVGFEEGELGQTGLDVGALAAEVKCKTGVAWSPVGALRARTARSSGVIECLGAVADDGDFVVVLHVAADTWSVGDDGNVQGLQVCCRSNTAE